MSTLDIYSRLSTFLLLTLDIFTLDSRLFYSRLSTFLLSTLVFYSRLSTFTLDSRQLLSTFTLDSRPSTFRYTQTSRGNLSNFVVIKHFGEESLNVQPSCCLDVVVYMLNCVFWRHILLEIELKVVLTWVQIAIGIPYSGIAHERQPNFRHRKKKQTKKQKREHFKTPPRLRQAE